MSLVKMTLAEALARPITVTERTHFAALATKPDAQIDFSDQPEITAAAIAVGHVLVTGRGGVRTGAGREASPRKSREASEGPACMRHKLRLGLAQPSMVACEGCAE
jgi:hypothetical protein